MKIKWINLNSTEIFKKTLQHNSGHTQGLSPFDVPTAAGIGSNKGKLVIIFRYIGGEERTKIVSGDGVTFEIGRSSNRLYRIEAKLSHFQNNLNYSLNSKIDNFLDKQEIKDSSRGSYKAAEQFIKTTDLNTDFGTIPCHG